MFTSSDGTKMSRYMHNSPEADVHHEEQYPRRHRTHQSVLVHLQDGPGAGYGATHDRHEGGSVQPVPSSEPLPNPPIW